MDLAYAREYQRLAREHWWWRARRSRILPIIARHTPREGAILDVGCAGGVLFPFLDEIGEAWGIEPDPALVGEHNEYRNRIHLGYLDDSYRPPRRFSVILFLDVLEHLDDPAGALRLAAGVLERDGMVVVTVPAFTWLWSSHDVLNRHRTRYTRTTIAEVASSAGFMVEESSYFSHWTVPLMWARTMMEKIRPGKPAPPMLPPPLLNNALAGLSRLEFQLLSRFKLPFGSSVLAVLRPRG
jgi:SAM-dependent methyltransferase